MFPYKFVHQFKCLLSLTSDGYEMTGFLQPYKLLFVASCQIVDFVGTAVTGGVVVVAVYYQHWAFYPRQLPLASVNEIQKLMDGLHGILPVGGVAHLGYVQMHALFLRPVFIFAMLLGRQTI